MKKRLIFYFYISNDWKYNVMNKIHLYCLKYYSNIFSEIVFFVSVDDVSKKELIFDFEQTISNLKLCENIQFKVKQNNLFREAQVFYDEIIMHLSDLDGLTFFAHNKGITNYYDESYKKEDVIKWVTSMYYGCLSDISEMELFLTDKRKIAYGTLFDLIKDNEGITLANSNNYSLHLGKYKYFYMGTFFWMNCRMIDLFFKNKGAEIPMICDRWYAENFFSNIIDDYHCSSFGNRYTCNHLGGGWYDIDKIIYFSMGEEMGKYLEFNEKVKNNCL